MNEYEKGIKSEKEIIKKFNLTPSSKSDNITRDIDAWNGDTAISIKTQHTALKTGNVCFEIELINHEDPEDVMPSWFYTGESDEYWVVVGDSVYVFDTDRLKEFVHNTMWMHKTTMLTNPDLIEENILSGRKYCQSKSVLVKLEGLINSDLVDREMFIL